MGPQDFEGFDAVVHLAELSNDPLGENRPEITFKINHEGSVRIAKAAKQAGVRRFVYASSCSVYGVGSGGDFLDETSPDNPQTAYAKCKVNVERDLQAAGGSRVLRHVSAQLHGLWTLATYAFRHRAERSLRTGVDEEEDRDGERRQSLAPYRAHRGHHRGGALHARGAARGGQRRGLQRRDRPPRTTASARSPRSSQKPSRAARSPPGHRAATTAATA